MEDAQSPWKTEKESPNRCIFMYDFLTYPVLSLRVCVGGMPSVEMGKPELQSFMHLSVPMS